MESPGHDGPFGLESAPMSRQHSQDETGRGQENRLSRMTSVSAVLKRVTPDHGLDWRGVVGPMLAGLTVPVGVNDAGVLRVMAVNETAMRELLARSEALLSVWNSAARLRGDSEGSSVQCWVRPGLKPRMDAQETIPEEGVQAPNPIPPGCRADAEAMMEPVEDDGVRAALVEMRARALAARRDTETGES